MTNGIAKLLRELVGELPTGGSDVVGLKAAVERLGEENRALGEEKGALERSVEEIRRAQEGMANEFREAQKMAESRMEARLALLERKQEPTTDPRRRPSESPAPFAVVPPLPQVVEMEERLKGFAAEMGKVEVALSEVGRKRKAEGGTLWEEVERMEKRMEGVEERDKDRIEKEREKELQEKEKDVEMKDLVDPVRRLRSFASAGADRVVQISDFKDRLAFIENEIKALPPPVRPRRPARVPPLILLHLQRSVTPDLEKKEAVASVRLPLPSREPPADQILQIINIKDRLAAVENEIKTLPVPVRLSPSLPRPIAEQSPPPLAHPNSSPFPRLPSAPRPPSRIPPAPLNQHRKRPIPPRQSLLYRHYHNRDSRRRPSLDRLVTRRVQGAPNRVRATRPGRRRGEVLARFARGVLQSPSQELGAGDRGDAREVRWRECGIASEVRPCARVLEAGLPVPPRVRSFFSLFGPLWRSADEGVQNFA